MRINYFFHIGSNKTGTTILARLIDQHPEIACMNEAFFYTPKHRASVLNPHIITPRHGYTKEDRIRWSEYIRDTGDLRQPIIEALDDFAVRCGKVETVGDSWINYIDCLDRVIEYFPDAKFIYNVRDPRAVYLSGQLFKNKRIGGRILRAMLVRDNILEKYRGQISLFIIRYEDLIRQPETTMQKVYNYLGHGFKPEYLEYDIKKDPYPLRWSNVAHPKIDKYHIDKWKRRLKPATIKKINKLSEDFMRKYKYEV